jgi:hypothetical protein
MKIIITESQYNLLFESKTDKFKKFLKDEFDFELEVKLIETYEDMPTNIRDLVSLRWFMSHGWANGMDTKIGGTTSLTGDRLNKLFNISEIGLDPIDIIKLYL